MDNVTELALRLIPGLVQVALEKGECTGLIATMNGDLEITLRKRPETMRFNGMEITCHVDGVFCDGVKVEPK